MPSIPRVLTVAKVPNSSEAEIYWTGGGQLPKPLEGRFTSVKVAEQALNLWQLAKEQIVKNRTKKKKRVATSAKR